MVSKKMKCHVLQRSSSHEIMIFLGGLVHKPEISLYWSKSALYSNEFIPKIMGREWFELL